MWPLDARELAEWWDKYNHAKRSYVHGFISRIEAMDALRNLRYRSDALKIEILEWERAKIRHDQHKRSIARSKLRDYIDEGTTPTSSDI